MIMNEDQLEIHENLGPTMGSYDDFSHWECQAKIKHFMAGQVTDVCARNY